MFWSEASWFWRDVTIIHALCSRCAKNEGWFVCSVPLTTLSTFAWLHCFCFRDANLSQNYTLLSLKVLLPILALMFGGRADFKHLSRFQKTPVWLQLQISRCAGRCTMRWLTALNQSSVDPRASCSDVDSRSLIFAKLRLSAIYCLVN